MAVITEIGVQVRATELQQLSVGTSMLAHVLGIAGIGEGRGKATLPSGTASGQANRVWSTQASLAGSVTSIDLAGTLTSKLDGSVVTFVTVKGIMIRNTATTTAYDVAVGGNANAFASWLAAANDELVIGPGGVFLLTSPLDGYAVTAGTGDILDLDPGANTITVEVLIWGTSA